MGRQKNQKKKNELDMLKRTAVKRNRKTPKSTYGIDCLPFGVFDPHPAIRARDHSFVVILESNDRVSSERPKAGMIEAPFSARAAIHILLSALLVVDDRKRGRAVASEETGVAESVLANNGDTPALVRLDWDG